MSNAAKSVRFFGLYLVGLGAILLVVPNVLLSVFGLPMTSEVWIRVAGMLVLLGLAAPALILFGAVDLAGAIWTGLALRQNTPA